MNEEEKKYISSLKFNTDTYEVKDKKAQELIVSLQATVISL